jgi:ppGpp synthetase/RelA/SpoT-type nucleotidyltranferase
MRATFRLPSSAALPIESALPPDVSSRCGLRALKFGRSPAVPKCAPLASFMTIRQTIQLEPTGRPAKSTTSIIEKLSRETIRLTQMQDIAGCRLVVRDVSAQNEVVGRLKGALQKALVIDRRKEPSYGYRALHIVATARGKPIEIQIRTDLQHLWAQLSEKLSDVLDPAIKYGGGDSHIRKLLSKLSDALAGLESGEQQLLAAEGLIAETQPKGNVHRLHEELLEMRKNLASANADLRKLLADAMSLAPDGKNQGTE